jgi:hypothetical protein
MIVGWMDFLKLEMDSFDSFEFRFLEIPFARHSDVVPTQERQWAGTTLLLLYIYYSGMIQVSSVDEVSNFGGSFGSLSTDYSMDLRIRTAVWAHTMFLFRPPPSPINLAIIYSSSLYNKVRIQ